jgi:hypothetical protein
VFVAAASCAFADNFGTLNFTVGVPGDTTMNLVANGQTEDVYIGPYTYSVWNPINSAGHSLLSSTFSSATSSNPTQVTGFCVDYVNNIYTGTTYTANVLSLGDPGSLQSLGSGTANVSAVATEIKQLMTEYETLPGADPYAPAVNKSSTAFQLALWAVVTDKTLNPTNIGDSQGAFYVPGGSTVANLSSTDPVQVANALLQGMSGTLVDPGLGVYSLVPTDGDQIQSLVLTFGSFTRQSAPEPASLVGLCGLALCGLPIGVRTVWRRAIYRRGRRDQQTR